MHGFDHAELSALTVVAVEGTALPHGPAVAVVVGIGDHIKAVAYAEALPVHIADTSFEPYFTGSAPASVVLQASVDMIGKGVIYADVVELPEGQVVDKAPVLAAVLRDVEAAIVSEQDEFIVFRVAPPGMVIGVYKVAGYEAAPGLASIFAHSHCGGNAVETVFVLGIDKDIGIVKGSSADAFISFFAHLLPVMAAIV